MTSTRQRVPAHTSGHLNQRIRHDIEERVRYYARHRSQIPRRLKELDNEWDIERAIECNASALAFAGVAMGTRDRRWLVLPALVTAFLFQHAVQGWCPPIPILRRLGFRSSYEIEQEQMALKALRGDFHHVARTQDRASAALAAVRA